MPHDDDVATLTQRLDQRFAGVRASYGSRSLMNVTRDRRVHLAHEAPQFGEDGTEGRQTALKGAWRADPEEPPHPEPKIECAGMHDQALQHVLVAAHVRAPQPTRLVKMRLTCDLG